MTVITTATIRKYRRLNTQRTAEKSSATYGGI